MTDNEKDNLFLTTKTDYMNSETVRRWVYRPFLAVSLMAGATAMLQSCEDDEILTGQPSWLGNSIYEDLSVQGNYKTTLKLIDDLGQREVLAKTGSKTIFAADDDAFQTWFQTNSWGVRSYDQLSTAQKKLLLNTSMINNAYLIELLSNVSSTADGVAPEQGKCMRRETAVSIYDTIPVIKPEDMPGTAAWERYRNDGQSLLLLKDNTSAPMIHLLPAFMRNAGITAQDLAIITNGEATSINEAYVNGKKVTERDITCKNGYIHKVEGVVEPASNMAEILRNTPDLSGWSHLVDRFSAPFRNDEATKEYRRLYAPESLDSVYVLRYYAEVAEGGAFRNDPEGKKVKATLAFDPGWNHYMYSNTMGYDLHYDAGAMIVPCDSAFRAWWNFGSGKVLKDQYTDPDSVPDLVLSKLINVNMVDNFSEKVPSKFSNILNDAKVELGIKPENVKKCYMGCNGIIYVVDKVFSPSAYASVSFPALINQDQYNKIYWAMDELEFDPYLGSMDSRYGLLIPTNDALAYYIDPINYGETLNTYLKFKYDEENTKVTAERWTFTYNEDGTPNFEGGVRVSSSVSDAIVKDRMQDLLDMCIIVLDDPDTEKDNKVTDIDASHTYYKTKGGSFLKVVKTGDSYTFQGGWQLERGMKITADNVNVADNGHSFSVSSMPFGASQTVCKVLESHDEYKLFHALLTKGGDKDSASNNLTASAMGSSSKYNAPSGSVNIRLFDNYNYSVYVPTNAAIQQYIDEGYLPTWEDYEYYYDNYYRSDDTEKQTFGKKACYIIKNRIWDFLRYHIQDNSIAIGGPEETATAFESTLRNPETNRFYPLTVTSTTSSLTVVDNAGNTRHVNLTDGLYNNICREYWLSGSGNNRSIYQASDAIVHQIDGVLKYRSNLTKWKDEINL